MRRGMDGADWSKVVPPKGMGWRGTVTRFVREADEWVCGGNADRCFPGESRKNADLGCSDLWRPMVVARTGGSKWQSALPTSPERGGVREADGGVQNRRPWPLQFMAANGRRQSRRQQVAVGPADRQQVGVGPADRQQVRGSSADSEQTSVGVWGSAKRSGASPSRRTRGAPQNSDFGNFNLWFPKSSPEPAAASACRLSLPGKGGLCDGLA